MISREKNDLMTRVGLGQPAGELLRCYWQPVALSEELAQPRPLKAVKLMGQDFVLFREPSGKLGLLDRDCPHRGADLAFGRLEDGGLRCPVHGWLFDASGKCLDTPAEPQGSKLCSRIHQSSYPVVEKNGVIFAYIGEGSPPELPAYDCFVAPESHTFAFKGLWECNWLQSLEVGMDPAHASFLHRFFQDEDTAEGYGRQFRSASGDSNTPITKVLREYYRPEISVALADYGLQLTTLRKLSEQQTHVRVTNVIFPNTFVIPMSSEMTISQWHVPIDDHNNYWYAIFTSFTKPVDKKAFRDIRLKTIELPNYTSRLNKRNDYGYNIQEQNTQTYTGMGMDINVHDQWACESMGPIQNRTREHLGETDKAIITFRHMLTQAIESKAAGGIAPMRFNAAQAQIIKGPRSIDGVSSNARVANYCAEADRARRQSCDWAKDDALA